MNEEIKEILDRLFVYRNENDEMKYQPEDILTIEDVWLLLDCITNLQEEVEDLREDNYAYHQLIRMENKREYRSKFLKEFQEEFGTNTFPDYDEIYKRYDKVKKENERLKVDKETMKRWYNLCKSRNEKAIELLNRHDIDTGDIYYKYKYNGRFVKSELKERIRETLGGDEE